MLEKMCPMEKICRSVRARWGVWNFHVRGWFCKVFVFLKKNSIGLLCFDVRTIIWSFLRFEAHSSAERKR